MRGATDLHETTSDESDHSSSTSESWKDEDYVSPLVLPRYPKRQCGPLRSPLRSPIRGPMITPAQSPQSQSPPEDQVHHATSASSSAVPHNTMTYVPTNFGDDAQSMKKDKCVTSSSVGQISPSQSFNMTEYVQEQQADIEDDPDEVEQVLDPAFDLVNGHKVKKEIAPLLIEIFRKHGDITSRCDIRPSNFLSYYLECVCGIYKRLEKTTFDKVTRIDLSDMLEEVSHLEDLKLSLGWLREKLESVSQAKASIQEYARAKDGMAENEAWIDVKKKKLEGYERELAVLQEKISTARKELRAEQAMFAKSNEMCLDIKRRVASLRRDGLVHGLLYP